MYRMLTEKELVKENRVLKKQVKDLQKAITAQCLVCCLNSKEEVRTCTCNCPLREYRPYK